jgi:hypothetical protein
MAVIERHPHVKDYFLELSVPEIAERGGIADLFEQGHVILLKDYRLQADFEALKSLSKSTDEIEDPSLRKKLKKMTSPLFFEGEPPVEKKGRLLFREPVRQALFDVLCRGDKDLFRRASNALESSHREVLRLFEICFPSYETFRLVPSVRLTQTLFENLHWDNHSIDADFHQARIFTNLDTRPRVWNVSHLFPDWVRANYDRYDLGRFAGKDPNLMLDFVTGEVLGGTRRTWKDKQPRHRVAFEPGEVWLGESRLVSHQIYYGEAAMVYMWFVKAASMADPNNRFNERVESVHREMSERAASASVAA